MIRGLIVVALLAFVFAFTRHTPGWMGIGIAVGLACSIAAALLFIERHVRSSARPEHMTEREVQALRGTLRKDAGASRPRLPPTSPD